MNFLYCVVDWEKSGPLFESFSIIDCHAWIDAHFDEYSDLVILFGKEDIYYYYDC